METKKSVVVTIVALLIASGALRSQTLMVSLELSQGERIRVSDVWNATVANRTAKPSSTQVTALVRDKEGVVVFKAHAFGPVIQGQATERLRLSGLRAIRVDELSPRFRHALQSTGTLPDGTWSLCLEVIAGDGTQASDCRDLSVGSALPPILLAPYDNAEVTDRQVAWSWFMQPRTSSGEDVRCNLTVVEVLPGQSPEEALRANPALIRRRNLQSAAWQADPATRRFRSGHRYAWTIQAVVGDSFEVCKSEIWSFTYRDPVEAGSPVQEQSGSDPQSPTVGYGGSIPLPDQHPAQIPTDDQNTTGSDRDRAGDVELEPEQTIVDTSAAVDSVELSGAGSGQEEIDEIVSDDADSPERLLSDPTPDLGRALRPLPAKQNVIVGDTIPLRLSVLSRMTVEHNSRAGRLAETPNTFARWELAPTVHLYGMPLTLNLLISSEPDAGGSAEKLDRGAFQFRRNVGDFNVKLAQRLRDQLGDDAPDGSSDDTVVVLRRMLDSLVTAASDTVDDSDTTDGGVPLSLSEVSVDLQTLEGFGLVQQSEATLLNIPTLGFGAVSPSFGSLLMNGVTINGGTAEYNAGQFYAGGAIGTMPRSDALEAPSSVEFGESSTGSIDLPPARQNVYVGRLGLGRLDGNHVILSGLLADDDNTSVSVGRLVEQSGGSFHTRRNVVAGLEGRYRFDALNLTLRGAVNTSIVDETGGVSIDRGVSSDTNVETPAVPETNVIDLGIRRDIAWDGRLTWQPEEGTRLVVGGHYVGPGYQSAGTAGLRNDVSRVDASFRRVLMNRRVTLRGDISHEVSGAEGEGGAVGTIDRISFGGDVRVPGVPILSLSYTATNQSRVESDSDSNAGSGTQHSQLAATVNYGTRFGAATLGLFVSANYQAAVSTDRAGGFSSLGFTSTARIGFGPALSAAVTYGLNQTATDFDSVSVSVPSLGATLAVSPLSSLRLRAELVMRALGSRVVTTTTTVGSIDLWQIGSFDLEYGRNTFSSDEKPEQMIRATVNLGF